MSESYTDRARKRVKETLPKIQEAVARGVSPVDAINKNASDVDSYNAALKHYGLKPHVHD